MRKDLSPGSALTFLEQLRESKVIDLTDYIHLINLIYVGVSELDKLELMKQYIDEHSDAMIEKLNGDKIKVTKFIIVAKSGLEEFLEKYLNA